MRQNFVFVSSIIPSLSSGKQDSANSARDSNSSDILSEVLVLHESKAKPTSKTKPALTKKIVCITDDDSWRIWKRKKVRKRRKQLESRRERRRESGMIERRRKVLSLRKKR